MQHLKRNNRRNTINIKWYRFGLILFIIVIGAAAYLYFSIEPSDKLSTVRQTQSSLPALSQVNKLSIGARITDESFSQVEQTIGRISVTRLFYPKSLPTSYSRQGIPSGVKLIISYKTPDVNVANYVKSIPKGQDVEIAFHHEPEADFTSGNEFVTEFDRQADIIHTINPSIPVDFIAGMYNYTNGKAAADGSFIPNKQDKNYSDSYQRTLGEMVPASQDVAIQNFIQQLHARNKHWDGFTEYGRGLVKNADDTTIDARRVQLMNEDYKWLKSANASLWMYWYVSRGPEDSWKFLDTNSNNAWKTIANSNSD